MGAGGGDSRLTILDRSARRTPGRGERREGGGARWGFAELELLA
jgi:hypothetical protein